MLPFHFKFGVFKVIEEKEIKSPGTPGMRFARQHGFTVPRGDLQ